MHDTTSFYDIASPNNDLISGSAPSGPSDTALSLRAAALLTLKSKRRKPAADQPSVLPLRPIPIESLQLDYGQGQEDPAPFPRPTIASSPAMEEAPSASVTAPTITALAAVASEAEDGQIREEGEISDTEESPAVSKPASPAPHKESAMSGSNGQAGSTKLSSPRSTSVKLEPISQPVGETLKAASGSRLPGSPSVVQFSDTLEIPHYIVDADHVRPGLTMNQQQYDKAKEVILDLLGWGYPPEDLTACCSREIVYYVFNELNLRLPNNLDITGLIMYPSSPDLLLSVPKSPPAQSRSDSASMPPPQSTPHTRPENDASGRPHQNLPHRPATRAKKKATAVAAAALQTSSPTSAPTPADSLPGTSRLSPPLPAAGPSLHDMEQQRRQELLARKAVQASRKPKPAADEIISPPSAMEDGDVEMSSLIPEVSVDDFLKSIGPVPDTDSGDSKDASGDTDIQEHDSPEPMEVDESVLDRLDISMSYSNGHDNLSSSTPSDSAVDPEPGGSHEGKGERGRRGTKRPVAADFVDFETGPVRPSSNGFTTRRKTGSFASVSGMRRCVIDLSDSEDDGGGGEGVVGEEEMNGGRWHSPARYASTPVGNGWATPPGSGGGLTPAALMEKEQEIKKMREIIAQKEESRLKKLAAMSSRTTLTAMSSGGDVSGSRRPAVTEEEENSHEYGVPEEGPEGEKRAMGSQFRVLEDGNDD